MKRHTLERVLDSEESEGLYHLPKGWVWTKMGEIANVITGNTPSKKDSNNYGNYIPFVKPPELNDCVINQAEDNLSEKGAKLARILPEDSVLVSCIGNLGKTGINKIPVAVNQQINAVIFPKDCVVPKYGFYYFQTLWIKKWFYKIASATTIPIVNKSKFETASIPLPPLPEQHRIVAKIEELFTELDAGVEALKKIKAQIKRYRQAVLKYAFEGRLTEEWRETNKNVGATLAVAQNTGQGQALPPQKNLPPLPEGWVWTRLGDVCLELVGGGTPSREIPEYFGGNIVWLTPTEVPKDKIAVLNNSKEKITDLGLKNSSARIIPKGSILLTSRASIGFVAIAGCELTTNQGFASFICSSAIHNFYLAYWLWSNKDMLQANATGTTFKEIAKSKLREFYFSLPPLPEQGKIVEEIERRFSVADEVEKTVGACLQQAQRLRQSILKRAFEGKLVPQDPNDEPAERLLERIKQQRTQFLKNKTKADKPRRKSSVHIS